MKSFTLKEAAAYLRYHPEHLRHLAVNEGRIPFSRPSGKPKGKILFRLDDLDAILAGEEPRKKRGPGRPRKSI